MVTVLLEALMPLFFRSNKKATTAGRSRRIPMTAPLEKFIIPITSRYMYTGKVMSVPPVIRGTP